MDEAEIPFPVDNGETQELQRCLTSIDADMRALNILRTELNILYRVEDLIGELDKFYINNPQGLIRKGPEKIHYIQIFINAYSYLKSYCFVEHKPKQIKWRKLYTSKSLERMFPKFNADVLRLEGELQSLSTHFED